MSQIQTDSSNVPTFKTNARDVVVDVVVRKDKGSLKGLKASDFQVFENGKPQKIDFFEEHTQRKLPPAALQPLPKMPPGVYTNVPSAPAGDSVNVLLLDKLNTETADQVYVRKEMLRFLAGMKPGMRTAIFVLGSQLHFIQGFTTDSSVLLAALKDKNLDTLASKNPYFHSQSDSEDDKWNLSLLATMGGFSSQGSSAGLQAMTDALAEEANVQSAERTALTLEALQFLARYLANVPGRKNLIWFAGTFPVNIFPTRGQLLDLQNQRVYLDQVKKTADLMTASRVAVYPIEAEGVMQNHSWISPSINTHITGANGSNTDNATRGINMVNDIGAENGGHADTIFAMEQLAEATGGKAFYNTNDLSAAMQNAIEDGSSYYTLVYSPTNKKMDGKFRKIEIKVDEKGCKLAYRQGYNADETPGGTIKEPSGNLRSMMVLGLPNATQVLYGLRVTPENPQPAPRRDEQKAQGANCPLQRRLPGTLDRCAA
ncbi:MAG: VWA domain-containing protein [Acidobacteriota bacterium]|nr:VWA domain-containing protein [Acidobacteriota bacterium]